MVHLEPTDKCNAACPQCPRNYHGDRLNEQLPLTELTINDFKKIFTKEFIRQLVNLYSCGNFGDPLMASDLLEIYKYLRINNDKINLAIITNGGLRSPKWWKEMAEVIGQKGSVTFSIDGLSDTNHIYRRKVLWPTLERNFKTFIDAGGNARWDFIVFRHNEHQIDEAKKLAEEWGFESINFKKTGRFFDSVKGIFLEYTSVLDKNGNEINKIYRPNNILWQNEGLRTDLQNILKDHKSINNFYDNSVIKCKVIDTTKKIFVNADGLVFPCCWLASQSTYGGITRETLQLKKLIKECGGLDEINAKYKSIEEIVNSVFFKKIKKSWSMKSVADGKLKTCCRTCSENFDRYAKQFSSKSL